MAGYDPITGNEQGRDAFKEKTNGMFEELYNTTATLRGQIENLVSRQVSKVGNFSRDAQLTGNQKISLPFKAKAIVAFATVLSVTGRTSWGFVDEQLSNSAMFDNYNLIADSYNGSPIYSVCINQGSNETYGKVTLIEDDGFTITWSKGGNGATGTIYIFYLAIR